MVGLEASAVALHDAIKLARRQHLWPLQSSSIAKLLLPLYIFPDRKREKGQKYNRAADQRWPEELKQASLLINNLH
jgi:hypothetical protein